jgi:hypothetical protein
MTNNTHIFQLNFYHIIRCVSSVCHNCKSNSIQLNSGILTLKVCGSRTITLTVVFFFMHA